MVEINSWVTKNMLKHVLILHLFTFWIMVKKCKSRDVLPQSELYMPNYTVYHNLSQIYSDLQDISQSNSRYIRVNWDYLSRLGLIQPVIHITNFSNPETKKVKILLSFGEHARELVPIESMFYLLKNFTKSLSLRFNNSKARFAQTVLSNIDLYISVIINPDGRNYIEKEKNYCWRGTSTGVDLNRNFDWNYGAIGSSNNKDDEEYRGSHSFSEPECRVLTDLTKEHSFDAFISFHSGIQQIYVPYADTKSKELHRYPENLNGMMDLAKKLSSSTVYKFTHGLAHQLNEYTADGTIFDYMAGNRKIPFSLAVELWGEGDDKTSKCFDLFNPRSDKLHEVVKNLHSFYEVLFLYMINWKTEKSEEINFQVPKLERPDSVIRLKYYFAAVAVMLLIILIIQFHRTSLPCCRIYHKRRIVSLRALSSTFSFTSFLKTS